MKIKATNAICFFFFLLNCSKLENDLKNLIPTDNSPAAPKVIASFPAPGQTGVAKDQKIIITFNKEVDKQSCIAAFSMQPSTTGLFEFNGPIMTFTPSRQFSGAITYIATLTNRCEDSNGRDLEEPYNIDFSVSTDATQPKVISIKTRKNSQGCSITSPYFEIVNFNSNTYNNSDVCANSPIIINFSKSMDRGSVESNFLTVPQLTGAFVWRNNNSELEFLPSEILSSGLTYILTISNQATDSTDSPLPKSYSASFTVGSEIQKPVVLMQDGYVRNALGCNPGTLASSLYPNGIRNAIGICSGILIGNQNTPIFIDFSESLDLSTADSLVTISPNINGVKTWSASPNASCGSTGTCGTSSRFTFTPVESWQHSVTYTVSFSGNIKDLAGNRLGENYIFSFTVGSDFQIPRVIMQDGFLNLGFGCSPGTLASAFDPVNGLRNQSGFCSSITTGYTNSALYIHFSEDMDRTSAENGLNISPAISGVKTWSTSGLAQCGSTGNCGTSSLLTFTPSTDWQNTTYSVTLGNSIIDLDGNPLGSSYSFIFTVGTDLISPKLDFATGPVLGDFAPACGGFGLSLLPSHTTNVCSTFNGSKIRVRFTEAMDQNKTTNSFSISPSVNGIISWPVTNELLFTPSQSMSLFTQYRISINSSASDIAGNRLASDFLWYFTTGDGTGSDNFPPAITNLSSDTQVGPGGCNAGMDDSLLGSFVNNVCTDNNGTGSGAAFQVTFSKNMEQNLTAQAFSISPSVSGYIVWISPTIMRFITTQSLNPSSQYVVSIGTGAVSSSGQNIETSFVRYFNTSNIGGNLALNTLNLFANTLANCQSGSGILTDILSSITNNACPGNPTVNPILLTFSQTFVQSTLINGFNISPTVSGYFSFPSANQAQFNPDNSLQFGKRYTITIPSSVTNSAGRGLQNTIFATFVVGSLDSNSPSISGADFEISTDGDGCGALPNDLVNQPNGAVVNSVCTGRQIIIHFSEAMDTNSVLNAISISPFINATYSFTGNDLYIRPLTSFSGNVNYVITISSNAKDIAGNAMSSSFTIGFNTENTSPKVVAIGVASQSNCSNFTSNSYGGNPVGGNWTMAQCYWSDGLQVLSPAAYSLFPGGLTCPSNSTTDDIRIIFNQAMDPVATINAISMSFISNSGGGISLITKNSWVWSDSFHVVTIQFTDSTSGCNQDLSRVVNITDPSYPFYLVQVDQTAKSANGVTIASPFNFILEGN